MDRFARSYITSDNDFDEKHKVPDDDIFLR